MRQEKVKSFDWILRQMQGLDKIISRSGGNDPHGFSCTCQTRSNLSGGSVSPDGKNSAYIFICGSFSGELCGMPGVLRAHHGIFQFPVLKHCLRFFQHIQGKAVSRNGVDNQNILHNITLKS